MTKRQLAALETRKKLMNAGKDIICRKGLSNTSVEEITEAAGVSKGTFYTYFRRKEDIVFELSRSMFGEILENAKAAKGDFVDKMKCYMVNFSGYIEQSSVKLAQEWVKNVVKPESSGEQADESKLSSDLSDVSELLSYGIRQGMLRQDTPVSELTHALVDLLYGQMLCWGMSDGAYSLRARTQEFCDTCLEQMLREYCLRAFSPS